jgi:hypothetical protein
MQEEQTVPFSQMYVDGREPWFTQLFVLYLLVVLVLFLVRIMRLTVNLRKLRNAQKQSAPASFTDNLFADCHAKAQSFRDFSTLTFLVSLLNFAWFTTDVFSAIWNQKTTNVAYVLARIADGLVPLVLGLTFCVVLYIAAMSSEAALRRRKSASAAAELTRTSS